SGWQRLGTWTLPFPKPTAVSVTPSAGTAPSAVLQAVVSDVAGGSNINDVLLLMNNSISGVAGCYLRYRPFTKQLFLANDAGTAFLGPIIPGTAGTLENSQCILNGAASSAVVAGNNLTLSVSVSFKPSFAGLKNIYLSAVANALNSGWTQVGTWTLPFPKPTAV